MAAQAQPVAVQLQMSGPVAFMGKSRVAPRQSQAVPVAGGRVSSQAEAPVSAGVVSASFPEPEPVASAELSWPLPAPVSALLRLSLELEQAARQATSRKMELRMVQP
jgi:hypothetical protein